MSFMVKKKRWKFNVTFEVEELSSVPLVSGMLFAKIRLLEGGNFMEFSNREEVCNHRVRWQAKYTFPVKMVANANTGVLEACVCRVSIRKELKGGKSSQKLGYADINLAEFAGAGRTGRKFLLEGYDPKRRQDNSTLLVRVDMALMSGDSVFKVPKSKVQILPGEQPEAELQLENKGDEDHSTGSIASGTGSSGFGSLPRKPGAAGSSLDEVKVQDMPVPEMPGHSRNDSATSQASASGGSIGYHSRQSSNGEMVHKRTPSSGSGLSESSKQGSLGHTYRQNKKLDTTMGSGRLDSTRVDADVLVEELIQRTNFNRDEDTESPGLQLFVGKDGKAVLGSQKTEPVAKYKQVVVDTR